MLQSCSTFYFCCVSLNTEDGDVFSFVSYLTELSLVLPATLFCRHVLTTFILLRIGGSYNVIVGARLGAVTPTCFIYHCSFEHFQTVKMLAQLHYQYSMLQQHWMHLTNSSSRRAPDANLL